ncbi:MAG: hypothetical protein ACKV2V_29235 [Blastocatellia bacterium]
MKLMLSVALCLLCFVSVSLADPTPRAKPKPAASSRFADQAPKIGDYAPIRLLSKFHLRRPSRKWEFAPREVADLMIPKAAPKPRRQSDFSEPARIEFYAGYAFTGFDAGDDADHLHGWNASVAGYFNKHIGIAGDFGGGYLSDTFRSPNTVIRGDLKLHTFLTGPRFRGGNERAAGFGHVMIGSAIYSLNGTATIGTAPAQRFELRERSFAVAFGGGVDIKMSDKVAFRLFQTDYILTRFLDETQHSVRVSTGLVFR